MRHQLWLGFDDLGGARPETMLDAWGVRWKRMGDYITPIEAPLAKATIEAVAKYAWPDPERYIRLDELRDRLAWLKQQGSFAITARAVNSYGPFEQASALRGREQFLIDLLMEPELAQLLIDRVTDIIVRLNELYLDVAGQNIDLIEIPGDDYAGTNNLIFSPEVFETMLKPALARIIRPIKEYRADLFVAFHSDGAIMKLLPGFVDLGLDLFHPLEPLPANDLAAIKQQYGQHLSFMGAIDLRTAMTGSVADVAAEVKRRIAVLAPKGGYILAPANHIQTDVPPENIVALYEFARQFGRYPIN